MNLKSLLVIVDNTFQITTVTTSLQVFPKTFLVQLQQRIFQVAKVKITFSFTITTLIKVHGNRLTQMDLLPSKIPRVPIMLMISMSCTTRISVEIRRLTVLNTVMPTRQVMILEITQLVVLPPISLIQQKHLIPTHVSFEQFLNTPQVRIVFYHQTSINRIVRVWHTNSCGCI